MLSAQDLVFSGSLLWKLAIAGAIVLAIHVTRQSSRPKNFPPGPRTVPFLGNLLLLPKTMQWLKFHELSKQYGPIMGLKLGSVNCVIFSNWKDVREVFDRRSTIYNSRPPTYMGELVCPGDTNLLFVGYGRTFQMIRKAIGMLLNISRVDRMVPIHEAETTQMLVEILRDPGGYYKHVSRLGSSVVLASVFGLSNAAWDDQKVKNYSETDTRFQKVVMPGYTFPPIEVLPWLRYLPELLVPWKVTAREVQRDQEAVNSWLCNATKERAAAGVSPECFMKDLLGDWEKGRYPEMTWAHVAGIGGMLMSAGSGTTTAVLLSFIFAMAKHPEVLRKAQAEVDNVCGTSRSPTLNDAGKLPYVNAIMSETLRWRPPVPGGLPHCTTEDDWYEGYFIPKGSTVMINVWGTHHDEILYDRPEEFIPERFMKNKYGVMEDDPDEAGRRATYAFGAGRRICQGMHLAERSIMISMSKLIWLFDIVPPMDNRTGKPMILNDDVKTAWKDGLLSHPYEFPVAITPRSARHAEILMDEYQQAQEVLQRYET